MVDPAWAWEPYRPSAESPWDLRKAGHLYRRAAFGANWDELQAALKNGPEKTIDDLLEGSGNQDEFDRQTAPLAASIARSNIGRLASAWWVYRMLGTPHPLREKLTLFWHNHFATSNAKVKNAAFMLGQYELIERHALGSFRTLLQEMSSDPAMMVWLDTSLSNREMPNENYPRELMELFSLGIGHYTEMDVRQAARAFTGWKIKDGKAVFDPGRHDDGVKTVLGRTGNWNGNDVVRICLEQPSTALFITGKVYRFLVSESVPATPELLEPLVKQFRATDFDFRALVARILRSNLFFSPLVYRTSIKSPVDFCMGIVRALEGRVSYSALAQALESLGQSLFYPPSVKGWDGGSAWLNGQTLLTRQNLALALTSTEDSRFGRRIDPAALAHKLGKDSETEASAFFLNLFLQGDVPSESKAKLLRYRQQSQQQKYSVFWTSQDRQDHRLRQLCHLVLTMPEFQLC
jgi:uncharacterized protein (DUF1800 family)